jgi:hypothetical protein
VWVLGVVVGEREGGGAAMVRTGRCGVGFGSGIRKEWARASSAGSVGEYGVEGDVGCVGGEGGAPGSG